MHLVQLDLETLVEVPGPEVATRPFSIDRSGRRATFMQAGIFPGGDPYIQRLEFFFSRWDERLLDIRRLTGGPYTINEYNEPDRRAPVVSGDGGTVVFASASTLDVGEPDPEVFWRIYAYYVAADALRQVAGLPFGQNFADAAITDDGRWLSFLSSIPDDPQRSVPARLDLHTGAVETPVAGLDVEVSDAAITADGSGLVFATAADLDPRVIPGLAIPTATENCSGTTSRAAPSTR
jgi:hypothetical protein